MPINPYYQEELQLLRELGREFAHDNPTLARTLAERGSDPDVDRVLEGVAFLTGLIRQRLDDDLPELTQALIGMLWPHYLRPIPALSIAEFRHFPKPKTGATSDIPRLETELDSVPVDGTPCRFRTCYDVRFHPLRISDARIESSGRGCLRIGFEILASAKPETLALDPLRLYLHGDLPGAALLHLWLVRHARAVEIEVPAGGGRTKRHALHESAAIRPVGFDADQGLVPYPAHSFLGYRLLQEYFALPQKFLFVDVCGIPGLKDIGVHTSFDLLIHFAQRPPDALRVTPEQIRLHCTPIVNLQAISADPLKIRPEKRRYLLRPSHPEPAHFEVHSVDGVTGLRHGRAERRTYDEFYSFRSGLRPDADAVYYKLTRRPAVGRPNSDCFLEFVSLEEKGTTPDAETISVDLTCTNRTQCDALRPDDVRVHTDTSPQYAQFGNLTAPTRSVLPPLGGMAHWTLISHLTLHFGSLASLEGLRSALRLYCFHALHDRQAARAVDLRLQGITALQSARAERLYQGAPVRGVHSTLSLDEDAFASEGEMYLFASIVEELLALCVSLNSFSQLTVRGARHGEVYEWRPRFGRQIIL